MITKLVFTLLLFLIPFRQNSDTNYTKINLHTNTKTECRLYKGIDISFYQSIDWNNIDTTLDFIICKSSEGMKTDSKFKDHWDNIKITKGAYHFFRPQYSGIDQAQLFIKTVDFKKGNIKPIIDVELTKFWKYKKYRKLYVLRLVHMIHYIEFKTGVTPIIYTNGKFWDDFIHPYYTENKKHILWIADYRKNDNPYTPKQIPEWTIWQHTCEGKISGVNGLVDQNICKNLDEIIIK